VPELGWAALLFQALFRALQGCQAILLAAVFRWLLLVGAFFSACSLPSAETLAAARQLGSA
jgi:hypothetical protein